LKSPKISPNVLEKEVDHRTSDKPPNKRKSITELATNPLCTIFMYFNNI